MLCPHNIVVNIIYYDVGNVCKHMIIVYSIEVVKYVFICIVINILYFNNSIMYIVYNILLILFMFFKGNYNYVYYSPIMTILIYLVYKVVNFVRF